MLYLRHTRTGTRFEVIKIDKTNGTITMKGEYGTFTETYDPVAFKKTGYVLETATATLTDEDE